MSFSIPGFRVKPQESFGLTLANVEETVASPMISGLSVSHPPEHCHPIAFSERNYSRNREAMNMAILRNTQGLHAPLRLRMELHAVNQVGRLPFLTSSLAMHDALTGRDLEIGPEDIYNTAEFREVSGQPHAMVERSLRIL